MDGLTCYCCCTVLTVFFFSVLVRLQYIDRRSFYKKNRLKIAKKCWLYLDIFNCVKINVFRSVFAFRLEMHVRCDNQYKSGADRGNILRKLLLFECMGICVLSPAHEREMRGYLVYVLIVKYYPTDFGYIQPQYIRLDGLIVDFFKHF